MNNNTTKKIAYTFILALILLVLIFTNISMVYATTKQELQNERDELDKKIEETSSEIQGIKSQMSNELTQINRLNSQISAYQDEIEELDSQLTTLNTQITEKEAEIKAKEEAFANQKSMLEKRLVAIYENGRVSYLDMLLSSKSLSDFISKYYLISELANVDNELMDSIEKSKNEITAQKIELDSQKAEAEQTKQNKERKANTLNLTVSEKNTLVSNLSAEEQEKQRQLEEMEEDKRKIQREIASLGGDYEYMEPSAAGYICPLPGKSKKNITTGFWGYSGHTGADFACSAGTPVLAVKAGKVETSTALKNSNGSYRSYGEYITINHFDGTVTLYAHMLPGSRMVGPGDTVAQGQQIGQVGSTGNSTGPHLHFEVRLISKGSAKGKAVNPAEYLP